MGKEKRGCRKGMSYLVCVCVSVCLPACCVRWSQEFFSVRVCVVRGEKVFG